MYTHCHFLKIFFSQSMEQGLYQYQRLPFGLSCAPALFQKIINQTIADIPGVVCYLDHIIVTGKNT